jgi:hypothetical protein
MGILLLTLATLIAPFANKDGTLVGSHKVDNPTQVLWFRQLFLKKLCQIFQRPNAAVRLWGNTVRGTVGMI